VSCEVWPHWKPTFKKEGMMDNDKQSEKLAEKLEGASNTVLGEGLHTVAAAVNTAIDSTKEAVHEMRNDAMEAVNQTVSRGVGNVKEYWDEQQPRFERYITMHPWLMLGCVLVLGYLFTGRRQSQL
jgi:hypothetical protein